MIPIHQPSEYGSRGTKSVEFIQCFDGREPQVHKIWCLGSDGVTCEVHPTAQIDVGAETVGQLSNQYFAENERRIPVIGQISIKGSVKLLGIPDDAWGCGLPFIENTQSPTVPHG